MHSKTADFNLFSQPFDVKHEIANDDFPMELIELQSNKLYKSKLGATGNSVIEFYKNYLNESGFLNLTDHAKTFICMFGTTYMCELLNV